MAHNNNIMFVVGSILNYERFPLREQITFVFLNGKKVNLTYDGYFIQTSMYNLSFQIFQIDNKVYFGLFDAIRGEFISLLIQSNELNGFSIRTIFEGLKTNVPECLIAIKP